MAALAIVAQLLDLATYSPANERNPVVVALGPAAPAAKLALIALIIVLMLTMPDGDSLRARLARTAIGFVFVLALLFGTIGAWSNL